MRSLGALLLFTACSCAMMPLNKVVMRQMRHTPFTAVAGQMLGAASLLAAVPWTYRTTPDVYRFLVLPPLFATMLVTSMLSLQHASFGSIMAIRNTAPLVCLPFEHCFVAPQSVDLKTTAALTLVLAGCVVFVWHDLYTTAAGVALAIVNTLVGVFDRLVQRHLLSSTDASRCSVLFVNNLLGGVIVAALAVGTHEDVGAAVRKESVRAPWALSVVVGLCLGYTGVLAQAHVSATTHLLVSNLNRIGVLVVGSTWLGERVRPEQWLAAAASVAGTVAYSMC